MTDTASVVEHVVLLKLKEGTSSSDIDRLNDCTESLCSIPGVLSASIGKIFVEDWMDDRTQGYQYALKVVLRSKEALRTYQDHPDHVKVKKECLIPILAGALAVDWESSTVSGKS
eukprot:CAMPEP_0183309184 /NCGR_PEP_ID=MMETSP0160_2-20130417/24299_1 /TAXON_ID=2839 ORGANISM="Odontella Sinensis, Strain Grunow 1884" /NCGR_SAMPLE_ID=MMETSP0160_2 /ASSEMBLY_ACC=CAM_ASM_000250 /LENGTH=114 /DNA_ID=CAMNT_0025473165 /DNA_START=36 /DNA_END=380 /DNA_ORIENTATION=+